MSEPIKYHHAMQVTGLADQVSMTIGANSYIRLDSETARALGERLIIEAARAEGVTVDIRIRVDEAP